MRILHSSTKKKQTAVQEQVQSEKDCFPYQKAYKNGIIRLADQTYAKMYAVPDTQRSVDVKKMFLNLLVSFGTRIHRQRTAGMLPRRSPYSCFISFSLFQQKRSVLILPDRFLMILTQRSWNAVQISCLLRRHFLFCMTLIIWSRLFPSMRICGGLYGWKRI